jgi:hypothetical protein
MKLSFLKSQGNTTRHNIYPRNYSHTLRNKRFLIDGIGDKSLLHKMFSEKNIRLVTTPKEMLNSKKSPGL